MRDEAVRWAITGLSAPSGEPISDPEDLPDDLDELLALANAFAELGKVVYTLRKEVEAKATQVLGPGRWYDYDGQLVRWGHSYSWKADADAVEKLMLTLAEKAPDVLTELFNPNDIRKTAVEKAARALDMEPETVIATLLYKKWSNEPGLQWKPKET